MLSLRSSSSTIARVQPIIRRFSTLTFPSHPLIRSIVDTAAAATTSSLTTSNASILSKHSFNTLTLPSAASLSSSSPSTASMIAVRESAREWSNAVQMGVLTAQSLWTEMTQRLWEEWWILMAAPKKKTSKMKQRLRRCNDTHPTTPLIGRDRDSDRDDH